MDYRTAVLALVKVCKDCGVEKPISQFYAQPNGADGLKPWCIECYAKRARDYYDRGGKEKQQARVKVERANGREADKKYAKTPKRMASLVAWQKRNPEKVKAVDMVNKNLKYKTMFRRPSCNRCGKKCKTEGHHRDYARPLEVEWLCTACHDIADKERKVQAIASWQTTVKHT